MRSFNTLAACAVLSLVVATPLRAATRHVGGDRDLKTINAALTDLAPGDVVEIDPGTYHETVRITANGTADAPIVIRGVGDARPVIDAADLDTGGRGKIPRAAVQIEGAHVVIEHMEVRNARNGQNAAGVRLLDSTAAVIRGCVISRCDMGIFGSDRQTATIDACEIFENGTQAFAGFSHNLYMAGNRVVVRNCSIHDALFGQNYKSRAHYNELWFNRIYNSQEGEVGCVDERGVTDRPNSNTLMVGNVVISKAQRSGNTAKFVLFGTESSDAPAGAHDGTLFLFNNVFVSGSERIRFITLDDPKAGVVARNNTFMGGGTVRQFTRSAGAGAIHAAGNVFLGVPAPPPGWAGPPMTEMHYTDGDGAPHAVPADKP